MTAARPGPSAAALALVPLLLAGPLRAQATAGAKAPRGDSEAWEWVAGGAAIGTAVLLDGPVRRVAGRTPEPTAERLTAIGNRLGHSRMYYTGFAAIAAGGLVAGDTPLVHGALRSAAALLVNGIAVGALKYVVGRGRPIVPGDDGDEFRPMAAQDLWHSFPSRHTATAFTLASVAAAELHQPVATVVAYGAAALVGVSRIEAKEHWTSDVVGGAILGMELSQAMERWMGAPGGGARDAGGGGAGPVVYLGVRVPAR